MTNFNDDKDVTPEDVKYEKAGVGWHAFLGIVSPKTGKSKMYYAYGETKGVAVNALVRTIKRHLDELTQLSTETW